MRAAKVERQTTETTVTVDLKLDGGGASEIATGIGFFDHMLTLWARHGLFDLQLEADGDLYVDGHHTVEDTGIVLGQAIHQALGDKVGIRRYGNAFVPMDEALVQVCLDISGRPFVSIAHYSCRGKIGEFDAELLPEFLRAVATHAGLTLHVRILAGENGHHVVEGVFKAFARALDEACRVDSRIQGVMSTKGVI